MGSNAARSVPIISWHRPAQRHLVPDLGAAAALPHKKKVGLGLISHSILLLTVCMGLYSKKWACMCVSVCLLLWDSRYISDGKVRLRLNDMYRWQQVLQHVSLIDREAECCWEPGVSFCSAVTWTSVCHAGPFLGLTPTLRLLKQPLSCSSRPIQCDSLLCGQCGPRFSALRVFVLRVYRRFAFPSDFLRHPPLHTRTRTHTLVQHLCTKHRWVWFKVFLSIFRVGFLSEDSCLYL